MFIQEKDYAELSAEYSRAKPLTRMTTEATDRKRREQNHPLPAKNSKLQIVLQSSSRAAWRLQLLVFKAHAPD